ncbi:MAG TPA: ABC transporter ATP-binding protein [Crocinitomix sp.]|nr:ABC transporter ATP-binding protein [Crocinitomix sp.]
MSIILEINNLYFKYDNVNVSDDKDTKNIIASLNLIVSQNEVIGIAGANGSGKSTLLKLIRGILIPYKGKITLKENIISQDGINYLLPKIKYITQNPINTLYPTLTLYENYMVTVSKTNQLSFYSSKKEKKKFYELLVKPNMGLEEYMNTQVRFLSGGQQQVFAVLLGLNNNENSIILLDEPTAALDGNVKQRILSLVKSEIKNQKSSAILISHEISDLVQYCDRVLVLKTGNIQYQNKITQSTNVETLKEIILNQI